MSNEIFTHLGFPLRRNNLLLTNGGTVPPVAPTTTGTGFVPTLDCFGDAPSMVLTVTGPSGTVNWCGQTWDLDGADSGTSKEICPLAYSNSTGTYEDAHYWKAYPSTGNPDLPTYFGSAWLGLSLIRANRHTTYGIDMNLMRLGYAYYGAFRVQKYWGNGGTYSTNGLLPYSSAIFGQFNNPPRTTLLGVGRPAADDYQITDPFFGSFTSSNGVTYAWSKGLRW